MKIFYNLFNKINREKTYQCDNISMEKYLDFMSRFSVSKQKSQQQFNDSLLIIDNQYSSQTKQNLKQDLQLPQIEINKNIKNQALKFKSSEPQLPKKGQSDHLMVPILKLGKKKNKLNDNFHKILHQQKNHKLQQQYDDNNLNQIALLKQIVRELTLNLNQLKDFLNNEKKLYSVLKHLIGNRRQILKIFINYESESLILPFTEQNILAFCQYKEHILDSGENFQIICYNTSLIEDFQDLKEKTQEQNIMSKINKLIALNESVLKTNDDVLQKEQSLQKRLSQKISSNIMQEYKSLTDKDLRFLLSEMKIYQPNDQIQEIELKFGQMDKVTKKSRIISQVLQEQIIKMHQIYQSVKNPEIN